MLVILVTGSTKDVSAVQEQGLVWLCEEGRGPSGDAAETGRADNAACTAKWGWPLSAPGLAFFLPAPSSARLLGVRCKHCCSQWLKALVI